MDDNEELRRQIERQELLARLAELKKESRRSPMGRWSRGIGRWILTSGVLLTGAGGATGIWKIVEEQDAGVTTEICAAAHAAVADADPNPHLTDEQNDRYLAGQLKVIERCNMRLPK